MYETRIAARESAEAALRELWDEDLYPVDPFAIARAVGIGVLFGDLPDDVSGMIRASDGEVTMYIDTDDFSRRQRFTAAHELGHYFDRSERATDAHLEFIDRRSDLASRGTDLGEIFANEFAAALLMPAAATRRLYRECWRSWELAQFFAVSPAAMTNRLRNLGLER